MKKALSLASLILAASVAACASSSPQDTKLSSDVERSLNSHPALQTDVLRVQSADHVVYLTGSADSWAEYYEAASAARSVPGVLRVVNNIDVRQGRS